MTPKRDAELEPIKNLGQGQLEVPLQKFFGMQGKSYLEKVHLLGEEVVLLLSNSQKRWSQQKGVCCLTQWGAQLKWP